MHILRFLLPTTVLTLVACAPQPEPATEDGGAPHPVGGRAVIGLEADPGTLNPVLMTNAQAARVFALLQPGLLQLDAKDGSWRQGLARRHEYSADSLQVRLILDSTLHWSDGTPFRAQDVAASYELYADAALPYPRRGRLDAIASVDVENDSTLLVSFQGRLVDPLALLTHDILPAHVIATLDRSAPESWELGRRPITLGRYLLAEWTTDARLLLRRNPHYPGEPKGLDEIELRIVPDAAARLLQLRSGELDLVASIPASQAAALRGDAELTVDVVSGRSVAFLAYDLDDERLADPRVRSAIGLAIDRDALIAGPLFGFAEPASGFLPPVSWAHAKLGSAAYDPERARTLLAEAAQTTLSLTLHTVPGDPIREAVATAIQAQLAQVGIQIELRPMELASLLQTLQSEDFDLVLLQLSGPVDADLRPFFRSDGRFNFGGYASPQFDALVDAATSSSNRAHARALALQAERLLASDQPVSCLYYPSTLVARRQRLQGVAPDWLTPFAAVENWWIAPPSASR